MTYKWEVKNKYQADDLLIKPVSTADLLQCVEKHLRAAATLNQLGSRSNDRDGLAPASEEERDGIVVDASEIDDLSRTHPAA